MQNKNATSSHSRPVVLVVDDEAVVTKSMVAFFELETDYEILSSQSPSEALGFIKEREIDLVISDFLMPEMNGLEFLAKVKRLYPDVPRILLTGYADKENSIRAINEVGLYQYIEKPWDNEQLKLIAHNAISQKSLQETLQERIRELDVLLRERNKLAERDELVREELTLARRLQESLLPKELPSANGIEFHATYRPAFEIGGDFYDVIPLARGRVAALVADATGHGIQAALSTALLKFAFSRYVNCDVGPQEILKGMNKVLHGGLPQDTFVAAQVAVVDLKSAHCRIANAGIPHPMLLHRPKSQVERVIANGFILGIIEDSLYQPAEEESLRLESGDLLLMYTDGISEPENERGEQFDASTFKEALLANATRSSDELSNALIAASKNHSRPDHEWDDITLLGITYK